MSLTEEYGACGGYIGDGVLHGSGASYSCGFQLSVRREGTAYLDSTPQPVVANLDLDPQSSEWRSARNSAYSTADVLVEASATRLETPLPLRAKISL